jgi:phage baseplate assembly protein gpV
VAAAEKLMLGSAASGQVFDGADVQLAAESADGEAQHSHVAVRAEILRHLLTADDWPVDPKGVQLRRVRISGRLDLEAATVRCPLVLTDCDLDDSYPVIANFATIPLLAFRNCRLAGFSGDSLTAIGNVNFSGSHFAGAVVVSGARIGGALLCSNMRVGADAKGYSLSGHGMNVRLSLHLNRGFVSDGGIVMPRAEIGGEFICQAARLGVNEYGISLEAPGIRVGGALYLSEEFSAQGAVSFAGANIGGQIRYNGARIGVDGSGNSLLCDGMRTGGSMNLDRSRAGTTFIAAGAVRLAGAEITGSFTCRGAQLGANRYGNALIADELKTSVAVLFEEGFVASGAVRLPGAEITGQFRCQDAQITGMDKDSCSLVCTGFKVSGPAQLGESFTAAGGVVFSGADFGGTLRLSSAELGADLGQRSLAGDGIKVSRDLLLAQATCAGGILLTGASVGGTLDCTGARLGVDHDQNSLVAGRLSVGGDLKLDAVSADGAVTMAGAGIGGRLTGRGARLSANTYENALNLNGSRVGRAVQLGKMPNGAAFTAGGMVLLAGAEITGSLYCEGSRLVGTNHRKAGLDANGVKIGGSAFLTEGFVTKGPVSLQQASIGGSLDCGGANLGSDTGQISLLAEQINIAGGLYLHRGFTAAGAIILRGATIGGELRWDPATPANGEVNLEGAHAHYLADEWATVRPLGFWPARKLRLTGFTYDGFGGPAQASAGQRLDWIRLQYDSRPGTSTAPPFTTQPYRQLSNVYRQAGQEDEARAVEIAMRRDMRKYGNLSSQRKALNWILDATIRYGFKTGRALAGIAMLYVIVLAASIVAQHQGSLIAALNVNNPALHPTALRCVTGYPCFYPAGFAFDTVVPIINIHQADFWQVNGHHPFGWAWVFGSWIATALGWFLATLLVVGYSGLAKQQ